MLTDKLKAALDNYIAKVQSNSDKHYEQDLPSLFASGQTAKFSYSVGQKYIKVIQQTNQKSVFCFVDAEGNLYKAATWNLPAKGTRGNIYNETFPLTCGQFYKTKH